MGKKVDTSHIPKLNGKNYQNWKFAVTYALKAAELWEIVSGDKARPTDDKVAELKAWIQSDVEASALIVPLVEDKQVSHLVNCKTAGEMWNKLTEIHSDASKNNKHNSLTRFYGYQLE